MLEDEVWQIVEQFRPTQNYNLEEHILSLTAFISELPESKFLEFAEAWEEIADKGYKWAMFLAFDMMVKDSCTDEVFDDCISTLIFYGRNIYNQAIEDPDSMASLENFEPSESAALFLIETWDNLYPGTILPKTSTKTELYPDSPPTIQDQKAFFKSRPAMFPKLAQKYGYSIE